MIIPALLHQKVAVITGATRGIGLATARVFAEAGATVILLGRHADALDAACQGIRDAHPAAQVQGKVCDVTDSGQVREAFQAIQREHKRLHALVANAGVLDDALIGMVSRDQIDRTFATNTYGTIFCAQYASRLIARAGGGAIINVSSIIGRTGNVGQTVYAGSKAAVIGITQSLAKELAPQNIRVNAIAPGFIDTDMARSIPADKFAERLASIKMNRIGSPDEVARVALFLASDLSTYVTGQVIGVDGGMLI